MFIKFIKTFSKICMQFLKNKIYNLNFINYLRLYFHNKKIHKKIFKFLIQNLLLCFKFKYLYFFYGKKIIIMHLPGIEPGSLRWQRSILPLDHRCLIITS